MLLFWPKNDLQDVSDVSVPIKTLHLLKVLKRIFPSAYSFTNKPSNNPLFFKIYISHFCLTKAYNLCHQVAHLEGRTIFVGGLGPEISSGKGNDPSGRY